MQWGSNILVTTSGGYGSIVFPTAFINTNWVAAVMNGESTAQPQMLILKNRAVLVNNRLDIQAIHAATGAPIGGASVRIDWIAFGG